MADILEPVHEVERLRARINAAHEALVIDEFDGDSCPDLESTITYALDRYRAVCESEAQAADEIRQLRAELKTSRAVAAPCSLETEIAQGKRLSALGLNLTEAHFVIGSLLRGTPEGLISAVLTEIEQRRDRMSDREHDALMDERMSS